MINILKYKNKKIVSLLIVLGSLLALNFGSGALAAPLGPTDPGTGGQQSNKNSTTTLNLGDPKAPHKCGSGTEAVKTTINFGCKGESCLTSHPDTTYCSGDNSAILDVTFAIIRFLSYGVGLIIVASIVYAGIQYTSSQGDPKATAQAETRIRATIIALLIYIFAYAILNYVIPKGFLR